MKILSQDNDVVVVELKRKEAFALCAIYAELADTIIPAMVKNKPLRQIFKDFSHFLSKEVFNGCIKRNQNYDELLEKGVAYRKHRDLVNET